MVAGVLDGLLRLAMRWLIAVLLRGACRCVLRQPVRVPVRCMMCWQVKWPVCCVIESLLAALLAAPVRRQSPCM